MFSISNNSTPRTSHLNIAEQPQQNVSQEVTAEPGVGKKEVTHKGQHISALQYADSKAKQLLDINSEKSTLATVNEQINERVLTRQQFEAALMSLGNANVELTEEQKQQLQQEVNSTLFKSVVGDSDTFASKKIISDVELWGQISKNIGSINDSYLKMYESAVAGYTSFYQELSEKVLAKMGGWVQPGKDGNSVKLSAKSIADALSKIIDDKSFILVPPQNSPYPTFSWSEAETWAKELGLPTSCIQMKNNGGYVVIPDLTPLKTMLEEVKKLGNGDVELDNAKYQAWQAGFKSQEEDLKTTLQTLTQKYSNANSIYDNLVKVLSSTISSCLETAKSFLQG